jgi:long-chain fatty acid transport protein
MSPFDKYAGLLSDAGDFDIPSNFGAGASCPIPTTGITWAADYVRIVYSDVDAVHNPSFARLFAGVPLGASNGPGFGWRDMNVFKLGLSWADPIPNWIFRVGYNHGKQPIPAGETLLNSLAPAAVENHFTLGITRVFPGTPRVEVTGGGLWAPKTTVSGSGSIPPGPPPAGLGGGEATLRLEEWSFGIATGIAW